MSGKITITLCVIWLAIAGCKKDNTKNTNTNAGSQADLEQNVLTDFADVLVNPNYQDIQAKALIMNNAIIAFNANSTDDNLAAVRTAWKNTRAAWESCEGFLFGPVEDYNYDPTMDDWPVNKADLDALIASSNTLQVSDVDQLGTTLKGFHAIEYIVFGVGSMQKAANITARDKQYLASLGQSLYNTTTQLRNSWDPTQTNNFTVQVVEAGKGSTRYTSRQEIFLALVGSMADICNEVANEKMQVPLAAQDSTLDESSFSHNSVSDFKNNITGVLNAYKCQYSGVSGHSLSELVASINTSLDLKIQSQINAAITSFNAITTTYEKSIYTQQNQIKAVQAAVNLLQATLEGDLKTFVQTNVKD
jgi:putative iron-regulated protein